MSEITGVFRTELWFSEENGCWLHVYIICNKYSSITIDKTFSNLYKKFFWGLFSRCGAVRTTIDFPAEKTLVSCMYVFYKSKAVVPTRLLCLRNKTIGCAFLDGALNAFSGLETSSILKILTAIFDCFTVFYRLPMRRAEQTQGYQHKMHKRHLFTVSLCWKRDCMSFLAVSGKST